MENLKLFFEINLWLIVFYAFYYLVLRKDTFHSFNRYYLIFSTLAAFVLPFISFDFATIPVSDLTKKTQIPLVEMLVFPTKTMQHESLNIIKIFWYFYISVVLILFVITLLSVKKQ